jgi:GT2 family glycosyltransferase
VVIATQNRHRQLLSCLDSLAAQDFPPSSFEVIVVDDGSRPPLAQTLGPNSYPWKLRTLRTECIGCGPARNAGAAIALGHYVAFTDDDCVHPPNWLSTLAATFQASPEAMAGGRAVNVLPSAYSQATQTLVDFLLDWFNADRRNGHFLNSIAVRRQAFLELNGFDPRLHMSAEDRDFSARWRASGRRIIFLSDLPIHHAHVLSFASYWRQHFKYGRGAYRLHHISQRERPAVPHRQPLRFYTGLLLLPFQRFPLSQALVQSALIALAQVATLAGWHNERRRA